MPSIHGDPLYSTARYSIRRDIEMQAKEREYTPIFADDELAFGLKKQNYIFKVLAAIGLFLATVSGFTFFLRFIERQMPITKQTKTLEARLAETRLKALRKAVKTIDRKKESAEMQGILKLVDAKPPADLHKHCQMIRNRVSNYYKKSKKHSDKYPLTDAYFRLAKAFVIGGASKRAFYKVGDSYLSKDQEQYTVLQTYGEMQSAVQRFASHNHGTQVNNIAHRIMHPKKAWQSLRGNSASYQYNSYEQGNADLLGGTYTVGSRTLTFHYGPTPTSDTLFEGILQDPSTHILQHNLQHPHNKGERARIAQLKALDGRHPNLRFFSTPMDGGFWKKPPAFKNGAEFISMYEEFEKSDPGFDISSEVLTTKQKRGAFDVVRQTLGNYTPEDPEDQKRYAKALQVAVQGCMALGAILKQANDAPEGSTTIFGQACKQDIDRGVVANLTTQIFTHLLTRDTIDRENLAVMIGVIQRPQLVDRRSILTDRFQPFLDMLTLIGENGDQFREALRSYAASFMPGAQEDLASIQFKPA